MTSEVTAYVDSVAGAFSGLLDYFNTYLSKARVELLIVKLISISDPLMASFGK